MESIASIREKLAATGDGELDLFINSYSSDERSGVKSLIARAEKRQAAYAKELVRIEEMKHYEKLYADKGYICGVDEVGRGPLAGPVCAGAVILPADCDILYLNDSKQLSEKKREELYEIIKEKAVAWSVAFADNDRIDEINILQADYEAMAEAVDNLSVKPGLLLLDAVHVPQLEAYEQVSIIKGDAKSISIAAASIMAKVTRDRYMAEMDLKYPGYGFARNKGYGSAEHIKAIREIGPSRIHRRSFIGNFVSD